MGSPSHLELHPVVIVLNTHIIFFFLINIRLFALKVASKQSEIGIGQTGLIENYFQEVDFLPPMTYSESIISQRKPKEIVSFTILIYPVDKYVWAFTLFSSFIMFIALKLENKFSNLINGEATQNKDNYKGKQ